MEGPLKKAPTHPGKPGTIVPQPFSSAILELSLASASGPKAPPEGSNTTAPTALSAQTLIPQPFPSASTSTPTGTPPTATAIAQHTLVPSPHAPPQPKPLPQQQRQPHTQAPPTLTRGFASPFDAPATAPPLQPAVPQCDPASGFIWNPCGTAAPAPPAYPAIGSSQSYPAMLVPPTPPSAQDCQPAAGAAAYSGIVPRQQQLQQQQPMSPSAGTFAGLAEVGSSAFACGASFSSTGGSSFSGSFNSTGGAYPAAGVQPAGSAAVPPFAHAAAVPPPQSAAYPALGAAQPALQGGGSFSSHPSSGIASGSTGFLGLQPGGCNEPDAMAAVSPASGEQQAHGPLQAGVSGAKPDFAYPGRPEEGEGKFKLSDIRRKDVIKVVGRVAVLALETINPLKP